MGSLLQQRFGFLWLIGALLLIAYGLLLVLDQASVDLLFSEGRLVENATAVAYGLAILVLLAWAKASWRFRLHGALVLAILLGRELDQHKAFTSESLYKISYYMKDIDPLETRILAGIVLAVVLAVLIGFLLVYGKPLFAALRAGRPFAYSAAATFVLLPVSKTLDSSPRMLDKHLDLDLSADYRLLARMAEETLELAIPLLVVLAVVQYRAWRTPRA